MFPFPLFSPDFCVENLKADTDRKWWAARAGEKTISMLQAILCSSPLSFFFFFFLASLLCGMQGVSFLTRYSTHTPSSGSSES